MNNTFHRVTGLKPIDAIKQKVIPVILNDINRQDKLEPGTIVRYLYEPGELEGQRYRATDPIWSIQTYKIHDRWAIPHQPSIYHLLQPAPQRSFVREELQVIA